MQEETYRQCRLRTTDGTTTTVGWIESKYAVEGKRVGIQKPDKTWDDRWVVESVGETELPAKIARAQERRFKQFEYGKNHTHQ